jgi:ATP-binding cassette subfamily C (CFTR/MRP) protein 4
LEDVGLKEVI